MARGSNEVFKAAVMGFCIPLLLLVTAILCVLPKNDDKDPISTTVPSSGMTDTAPVPEPAAVQLQVLMDETYIWMDLEEYVLGAVLAEMPASFEMEALKAQAVAARTYALYICQTGSKHAGAVCLSSSCCQGYMTVDDYLLRGWGEKYVDRVRSAVQSTAGQVLTYQEQLIRSPYFSCSGGATEAAVTVWGRDYPYLQSVESPGEEETVYYTHSKSFSLTEFQEKLGVTLSGSPQTWFGNITYTTGGGIETLEIGGVAYRGTTLRSLLGLRSTVFQVVVSEDAVCFETRGYGHRVGMSQYGADAMAAEGYTYEQILLYYYQGTQLADYEAMR